MIELRCTNALHAKFDPDRDVLEVKCQKCSHQRQRPVYHHWTLREIIAAFNRGEIGGICAPTEPQFVHWRVEAA